MARYGGEEFAVVLPDTGYAGAMVLAERCRRAVAGKSWVKRAITISVGVTTLTNAATSPAALVLEALYHSKQGGRNRVSHARRIVECANERVAAPKTAPDAFAAQPS